MTETTLAWPHWMLRYVGSDDAAALEDLVGSSGVSPPWGGVSYDEAAAVYQLIEDYHGSGTASDESYTAVLNLLAHGSDRAQTIEIFRCTDIIQSEPEAYDRYPVDRGLFLARSLRHAGAEASFLSFEAGWHVRRKEDATALELTRTALAMFLELAEADEVYAKRVHQSAVNTVSLTARTGDLPGARTLLGGLAEVIDAETAEKLRLALSRAE